MMVHINSNYSLIDIYSDFMIYILLYSSVCLPDGTSIVQFLKVVSI